MKKKIKKTALVTGGTGFIGTYLCKKLLEIGWKVNIIDLKKSNDKIINKNCKFLKIDLNKVKHTNKIFKNINTIFHFAAIPSIANKTKEEFLKYNLRSTVNLIKCAKENKIKNIIYSSSSVVYYGTKNLFPLREKDAGKTIDFYGLSKWLGEKTLMQEKEMKIKILRPSVVIGPGRLGIFEILFNRILNNQNIYLIGGGQNYFQFTNVHDFVDASIKCIKLKKSMIFNVGSSDKVKTYDLLSHVCKKAKSKSKIITTPALAVKIALFFLSLINLSPLTKEQYLIADKSFFLETRRAKKFLNWNDKFTTKQTLLDAFNWFKINFSKKKFQTSQFGILTKFKNYNQSGFQK